MDWSPFTESSWRWLPRMKNSTHTERDESEKSYDWCTVRVNISLRRQKNSTDSGGARRRVQVENMRRKCEREKEREKESTSRWWYSPQSTTKTEEWRAASSSQLAVGSSQFAVVASARRKTASAASNSRSPHGPHGFAFQRHLPLAWLCFGGGSSLAYCKSLYPLSLLSWTWWVSSFLWTQAHSFYPTDTQGTNSRRHQAYSDRCGLFLPLPGPKGTRVLPQQLIYVSLSLF